MASSPNEPPSVVIRRVTEALATRNPRGAAEIAQSALAAGLQHPLLHTARALWLSEQGEHEEALADFRRAEAMGPAAASLKSAIALCLMRMGRSAEAVAEYDEAIAQQPNSAQLYCRKGWACEVAGDLAGARSAHEKAAALQPDYAEPIARLGFLAARRGSWSEAGSLADRALALSPHHPAAELARAMCSLEHGDLGDAEARLALLIDDRRIGETDRYLAAGLMGDLRDRQDRTAEAFALYERANGSIASATNRRQFGTTTMPESLAMLRAYFDAAPPRSEFPPAPPSGETGHIFVVGFLRSGTTLVQEVLASRSDTVVLDESDALADAVEAFMGEPRGLDRLWAADDDTLTRFRNSYWQRVCGFGVDADGKTLIDKMPLNTIRIPLIARLFPSATILCIVRDPRDVVLSSFRHRFVMNAATYELLSLEGAARLYDGTMALAQLYRRKLQPKLFELRLEDLIDDFDSKMKAVCEFAGLPWADSMRDFARTERAIRTPSSIQVVRGLNRQGIGQWRRYRAQLMPVMHLLAPWVERYRYAAD